MLAARIGGSKDGALRFPPRRLAVAAERGCLRALMELDRLAAWEARARTVTAG